MKAAIKDEYFEEEVVENLVLNGIEAKDRTFLYSQGVRNVIKNLLSKADNPTALCHAIETLGSMNLDGNAKSVLELLKRLSFQTKQLPKGYIFLFYSIT